MNKIITLLFIALSYSACGQTSTENTKILYGVITKDSLVVDPFAKWFNTGYDSYQPATTTVTELKKLNYENISIKIFFGTWCGDSKREVPRFLKLLSAISFPEKKLQLIAVGGRDSLVKQSPQHEEASLGIFRVPTFIIYKNGVEINRINEFPVFSLEKDLLGILTNQPYTPNYRSFNSVHQWMNDGSLTDENISIAGLAEQLRATVSSERELNSLGYLLLKQDKKKQALKIFRSIITCSLNLQRLIQVWAKDIMKMAITKKAIVSLERSLELNKDPKAVKEILVILYKAKGKDKD